MITRLLKSLADSVKVEIEKGFWVVGCIRQTNYGMIPVLLENPALAPDSHPKKSFDINETFDGFLWGVPTNRRSIEKRMMRKYGAADWHNKLILPKKNLLSCNSCGHHHEEGRLCRKYQHLPFLRFLLSFAFNLIQQTATLKSKRRPRLCKRKC